MMSCVTVKGMLSNYIEDTTDPDDKSKIQEHLEKCLECSRVFKDVRFLTQRLQHATTIKTSSTFDQVLRMRIIDSHEEEKPAINIRTFSYGLSGAALVAAISFIVITNTYSPSSNPASPLNGSELIQTQRLASPVMTSKSIKQDIDFTEQPIIRDSVRTRPAQLRQERIQLVGQEHKR